MEIFILSSQCYNTVWCRNNMVAFLQNYHQRHPIAHSLGRYMGCHLWVQTYIHILPQSPQWWVQYYAILDHVIMVLDCIIFKTAYILSTGPTESDIPLEVSMKVNLSLQETYTDTVECCYNSSNITWYCHDDIIKWKYFPRYWPFMRGSCFLWSAPEPTAEQTIEMLVI